MTPLALLGLVVVVALLFEFINGFHDTGNAIATVVSTGVLRARTAVLMAAVLNMIGAFWGSAVATTIGTDIVDPTMVTQELVLAALLAAILWDLATWWWGVPSSSSHALVGGLVGASWVTLGLENVRSLGIQKVLLALVVSPIFGFGAAFLSMVALYWAVRHVRPARINAVFRRLQVVSSGFMAFSHGTNDAQKTMGIITMALVSSGGHFDAKADFAVPTWVVITCAVTMGLGTALGGWRIIHTMGTRIFKLRPIHGFCAESSAAAVLITASWFGLPMSTTHCITSAIMGVGATTRLSAVSWGITRRILLVWVLTIPVCVGLGAALSLTIHALGG